MNDFFKGDFKLIFYSSSNFKSVAEAMNRMNFDEKTKCE